MNSLKTTYRRKLQKSFLLFKKEKKEISIKQILLSTVQICDSQETLIMLKKSIQERQVGGYLRFGDGDIFLLDGINDSYQKASEKLSIEMREAFMLSGKGIQKSLPVHSNLFGKQEGMIEGMHLIDDIQATNFLLKVYPYFIGQKIYSAVALHYSATFDRVNCLKFLSFLKLQKPIFVGNDKLPRTLIEELFSDVIIEAPSLNAYSEIDRIERDLLSVLDLYVDFKVIVVAMGCSGRILQKRILNKGYNCYLFDFGSLLDALAGLETREWISQTGITNLQTLLDDLR